MIGPGCWKEYSSGLISTKCIGYGAAFTANVTDVVPTGTSFNGTGSCTPGCTLVGDVVTWAGVTIQPGSNEFSFEVTITVGGGSYVTDVAQLDPSSPDLEPISSNVVVTPIPPFLGIAKDNSPKGPVGAGDEIT